jgi:WD40 repeat protein
MVMDKPFKTSAIILLVTAAILFRFPAIAWPQPEEPILTLEMGHHSAMVRDMVADAQNRILVTGSTDKTVRIWDPATGKLLNVLRPPIGKGSVGFVNAVTITPDGNTIACGGSSPDNSYNIYFFDRESGVLIKRISRLPRSIQSLRFSKNGRALAAGLLGDGGLRIYSFERKDSSIACSLIREDRDYQSNIMGLDFNPEGRLVASSVDGSLKLYSADFKLFAERHLPLKEMPAFARFSPDGSRIALGYQEAARVDIFSATDLSRLVSLDFPDAKMNDMRAVSWSPDGRFLYSAGYYFPEKDNAIVQWDTGDFKSYRYIPVKTRSAIRSILALQDGGIAYSAMNGDMNILDASGKEVLAQVPDLDHYSQKTFLISPDATVVMYDYKNRAGVTEKFSVETKRLESNPVSTSGMSPPITRSEEIRLSDLQHRAIPRLNGKPLALIQSLATTSYAISPDHRSFIFGTWWYLYHFDKNGKKIWHHLIPGAPRAVNISADGRLAVAGLSDGTIRWYRIEDGKELLAFLPLGDGKRWVLWTSSGYYDASERGDELIGWHVNNGLDREATFYPISRFFERFYRPEVMARVVKSAEPAEAAVAALGEKAAPNLEAGIKPPPRVAILSPMPGRQFDSVEQEVKIVAEDMGGGIDEVLLFQNGKVLPRQAGRRVKKDGETQEYLFRVALLDGPNQLRALALSKDRIESSPMEITVTLRGAERESDLHLVLVGINRYKNNALNLTYAEPDATGMKEFFRDERVKRLFKEVHVYTLLNDQATGANIRRLFSEVEKKARPQDTLLIYLAGHGDTIGEEWYFIPHDTVTPEIEADLKREGISNTAISEAIKRCKAQKVFVMIDACKSGKLILAMRSTEARKALVQLARSTGTYIISASTDQQYAAEIRELGHGVFTYTLLEGLQGKGGEKKVTVEGLIHYVKNRLPELTEKHRGSAQYPVSWGSGMDFPIVLY